MKKLFLALVLGFFLLLGNTSFALAAGYYNPIQDPDGTWRNPHFNDEEIRFTINQNTTNVTLMFDQVTPNACYVLGRSATWVDVDGKWWEQKDARKSGWTSHDYASQAGGQTCGFINNRIKGSGTDHAANYVRANSQGQVWFHNLCENMEGIRTDCNEKFALGKKFTHTLFQVVCSFHPKDADGKADLSKPALPDTMCDLDKADAISEVVLGDEVTLPPALAVFGADGSGSDKKIAKEGYLKVYESPVSGSFIVQSDLRGANDFNPESDTVKTELGTLSRDPAELATAGIRIGIGVGGGVAFLLMVFGSFRLIFAAGNPESVQSGREIITAAIIGLLIIVFATFILQLVGISIFGFNI